MVLIFVRDNVDSGRTSPTAGVAESRRRVGARAEERFGCMGGCPVPSKQFGNQRLLEALEARHSYVESDFAEGNPSVCCEGSRSTRIRRDPDDDSQAERQRCGDCVAGPASEIAKLGRILATGPVQDRSGPPKWQCPLLFSVEQGCSLAGFNF